MISPKDRLDLAEVYKLYRERHPELDLDSEDAENNADKWFDALSPEAKLKLNEHLEASATRMLRKIAIENIIREAITTVVFAVCAGALAYLFLGHPRWMVIAVCALGFGAYHTGLLYRIGLREDKKL